MMSWQAWSPPEGWPIGAPSVRWQRLALGVGHEACLWLFNVDAASADTSSLTACLSEAEQARAERFRQALHGQRHRVTWAMVRHLLARLCQRPPASLCWHAGLHGKPALLGAQPPVHFNLSHSAGWALLATSSTLELGVDVEERSSRAHLASMAERILSMEERGHPGPHSTSTADTDTLLQTWTRKEACLKALGTGLHRDMETLTLEAALARTADAHLRTHGPLPELGWADVDLPTDCQAHAACAWLTPLAPCRDG